MPITAYQHSLADIGYVPDIEDALLPAQAWPDGANMRFINRSIQVAPGNSSVYSATTSLIYLFNAQTPTTNYWVMASIAALYATDGVTFENITRLSLTTTTTGTVVAYTGSADHNWTMSAFGNFVVMCNGIDEPQSWDPSLANHVRGLTGWPAGYVAQAMRTYRNYLIAMDITVASDRYPSLVMWSDAATYDALPSTWIPATNNDAGDNNLNDTPGFCVDGLTLGGSFIVYKEDAVWAMTYVGGAAVMAFRKLFEGVGLLTRRCVQEVNGRHFFVSRGDIYLHDGVTLQSVASQRVRDTLFGDMDSDNYERTFTAIDRANREIWVCYPTGGSAYPNKALIYNYETNIWNPPRDITETGHIAAGLITFIGASATTFDATTGTFDSADEDPFDERAYEPSIIRLLSCDSLGTDLLQHNLGYESDGTGYTAYISRPLIPMSGQDVTGQATVWSPTMKVVRRVFVDVVGTGTCRVYVGTRETPEASPVWQGPFNIRVGTDTFVWTFVRGRFISIKFEGDSTTDQWTLIGYKLDWEMVGER